MKASDLIDGLHKEAANKMTEVFNLGKLTAKGLDELESHIPDIEGLAAVSRAGKHNGEVISRLRRKHGKDAVNVSRNAEPEGLMAGHTHIGYNSEHDLPTNFKADISLPNAAERDTFPELEEEYQSLGDYYNNLDDHTAKQLRGYIANHEISGEAQRMDKIIEGVKESGRDADNVNEWTIRSHATPDVVINDGALVRHFNGKTKNLVNQTSFNVDSGFSNKSGELTQNDFIQEVLDRDKSAPFYAYPFSHSDRKELMDFAHNINTGFRKGDDIMRDSVSNHAIGGSTFMRDAKMPKQASDLIDELYKEASSKNPTDDELDDMTSELVYHISKKPENKGMSIKDQDALYRKMRTHLQTNPDAFYSASKPSKIRTIHADNLLKQASEPNIAYHASPVQDIKKFRKSEDTSGANKGKIIFVSKDPSFCSAFGVRWNDANARLTVETTTQKPPTNKNYKRTVLRFTEAVDLDAPCSMYQLKGKFKPLRYEDDIEEYTDGDVEIVSEEKFDTFRAMAKKYGLEIREIKQSTVLREMKWKKTSNFEKAAGVRDIIDNLTRETLYHSTATDNVEGIKQNGILGSKANDDDTFTRTQMPDIEPSEFDDLVYLARKKDIADDIGRTKAYYKAVNNGVFDYSPYSDDKMAIAVANMPATTLTVKAPIWAMHQTKNPELLGADTWEEYAEREEGITPEQAERAFDEFHNNTVVVKGDVPAKYIADSPEYTHAGPREIINYLHAKMTKQAEEHIESIRERAKVKKKAKTASTAIDTPYKEAADNTDKAEGAALLTGSALMMNHGFKEADKGNLTGRETLYHNTDKRNVESIADKGVLASKANEPDAYTRRDILKNKVDPKKLDNLTYFARKEDVAEDVGRTRSYYQAVAEGKVNPGIMGRLNPKTVQSALDAVPNKTLTVKAPIWKMEQAVNPELRGAKTWQEFHKHFPSLDEHTAKKVFHDLSDNTVVVKGNMDPKYIMNSKHYKGANLAEVAEFAKHNPKRFGRAALPIAGASILGALGGAKLADHEKSASEMIDGLYKELR